MSEFAKCISNKILLVESLANKGIPSYTIIPRLCNALRDGWLSYSGESILHF